MRGSVVPKSDQLPKFIHFINDNQAANYSPKQMVMRFHLYTFPGFANYKELVSVVKSACYATNFLNGYKFELMAILKDDVEPEEGVVYLNEKAFFIKGMDQGIFFPASIDLENLEKKLNDLDFQETMLAYIADAGYTPVCTEAEFDLVNEAATRKFNEKIRTRNFEKGSSFFKASKQPPFTVEELKQLRQLSGDDFEQLKHYEDNPAYVARINAQKKFEFEQSISKMSKKDFLLIASLIASLSDKAADKDNSEDEDKIYSFNNRI